MWATLMQQWAQRYAQVADRPYAPQKRALLRAFFSHGLEKFALVKAVELLLALLHVSVLLFFIGLVDFLLHINHTVAYVMLTWVVIGLLTYFILTIMPLLFPNSPYQTPLSSLCWFVVEATALLVLWLRLRSWQDIYVRRTKIGRGMVRALESKATESRGNTHSIVLRWTLTTLGEDHKLKEFLDGLPGLFRESDNLYLQWLQKLSQCFTVLDCYALF
jgi:hypothetical protein